MCGQRQHHSSPKCLTSPAPISTQDWEFRVLGNLCPIHLGEIRDGQRALGNSNKTGAASASPSHPPCPQKPEGIEED